METTVTHRLQDLAEIAITCGTPWFVKLGANPNQLAAIEENWYKNY